MKDYINHGDISGEQINNWHEIFFKSENIKNKRVLDVGCAAGFFSREVNRRGGISLALDINPKLKNVVEKHNVEFISGTVEENLKIIKDFSPEIIVAFELIEHLYDPYPLLHQFKEILLSSKKNGKVFLSTPNAFNIKRAINFLIGQKLSDPLLDPVELGYDAEHIRMYSHNMVIKLLNNNGFEVKKKDILSRKIFSLHKYLSNHIVVRGSVKI